MKRFAKIDLQSALAIGVVLCVSIVLWLPRLRGPIDLRWDGSAYYELGTSLATGQGYRLLHEPGQVPSTLHAPMVPLIIALHQLVAHTADVTVVGVWLRHSYMALFVVYGLVVFVWLRRFFRADYACIGTLLVMLHVQTVFMSDLAFPELPYALATVLFTLCVGAAGQRTHTYAAAVLAAIAFATRTVGVALLAAWVIDSIIRRQGRAAAVRLGIVSVLIGAWAGYVAHVESGPEYRTPVYEYQRADYAYINVSYVRNLSYVDPTRPELGKVSPVGGAIRLMRNLRLLPMTVAEDVSTQRGFLRLARLNAAERLGTTHVPAWTETLMLGVLSLLIGVGAVAQLQGGQIFIVSYTVLSLLAIFSTPSITQFNRYVSPLTPFLVLFFLTGLAACTRWIAAAPISALKRTARLIPAAVVSVVLVAQLFALTVLYTRLHDDAVWPAHGNALTYRLFYYGSEYQAIDAALDWLHLHAPSNGIVAASVPPYVYLRTGMTAVLPPLEVDVQRAQRLLDSARISFLLVDEGDYTRYTGPVVTSFSTPWRLVYPTSARPDPGKGVWLYGRVRATAKSH